jgi:hypothetical protein
MSNICLDDHRRQAEARLVQQHQARPQHQGAGDGQHLLLAARKGARLLLRRSEAREEVIGAARCRLDVAR